VFEVGGNTIAKPTQNNLAPLQRNFGRLLNENAPLQRNFAPSQSNLGPLFYDYASL
jgi:hypothetical protein